MYTLRNGHNCKLFIAVSLVVLMPTSLRQCDFLGYGIIYTLVFENL